MRRPPLKLIAVIVSATLAVVEFGAGNSLSGDLFGLAACAFALSTLVEL